jgi:hypothetical protein
MLGQQARQFPLSRRQGATSLLTQMARRGFGWQAAMTVPASQWRRRKDSASAAERQRQHLLQLQLQLQLLRRLLQQLQQPLLRQRIRQQRLQLRLLRQRIRQQRLQRLLSQDRQRRHHHREFEVRQHRVLARRHRHVHSAVSRFAACHAEALRRRARSVRLGQLWCG